MKTLDLTLQTITLDELLKWASLDAVLILAPDGHRFVLEEAGEFEREVMMLGKSEKFMRFLKERSQEKETISLDDFEKTLSS